MCVLFERQTEIERLQGTLRSAAEKGRRRKKKRVPVCVCLSPALMDIFKNVYSVCLCDRTFAFSLLKCPAGRGEITGALKMVTER